MRRGVLWVSVAAALAIGAAALFAGPAASAIDNQDVVRLPGNVPAQARPQNDFGPADPALPMNRIIVQLRRSPAKEAELKQFLAAQQDPSSPDYHRWLTPEQFGKRFGPSQTDLALVTGWLKSEGFRIDEVAKGRMWINVSGTVREVEQAFHTSIHEFYVDGKMRHANTQDPAIPRALEGVVAGVVSLNDFPIQPMNSGFRPVAPLCPTGPRPAYTNGSDHYLAPADFATIYDVNPLYSSGITGAGVTIAIVGRTDIALSDINGFRSTFGLPANPPTIIVNGPDPGTTGDEVEADLDVEWSGAVAPYATIAYVESASTNSTDGIDLSAQYIVDNNLAPIMSTSYGQCEDYIGTAGNAFYNSLYQQAAAEGITAFVSAGDSGAAGCMSGSSDSLGVNGLGSTPYTVCVGGSEFMDTSNPSQYWSSNNSSVYGSALSYIPEEAWNESALVSGGSGDWATGGGASIVYPKPSWQVAPGVPSDGMRDVPDVALSAAGHDGYLIASSGQIGSVGGTSASSPSFAGLMALIVQKSSNQPQGNANVRLYQLGSAQYGSGGPAVFHDVTTGNNTVPSAAGFSCGVGYDQCTGLGTADATALVNNWAACPAITLSPSALANGVDATAYSATISATGGAAPYTYAVTSGSLPGGLALSSSGTLSGTPTASGSSSFTVTATDANGCTGSQAYSLTILVQPPVVTGVTKLGNPFRLKVTGSNFKSGIQVFIGGSATAWSNTLPKSSSLLLIKKGASLKALFPKGQSVAIELVNTDGGTGTTSYTR
ncbi:MAG: protease pro-enzyme activation domain-containing protein [Acidobacteriota bacterium]